MTQSKVAKLAITMTILLGLFFSVQLVRSCNQFTTQAWYLASSDTLDKVGHALETYKSKHGEYPKLTSFESMVQLDSPLVKESLIPKNLSPKDHWGHLLVGSSDKTGFTLEFLGDPTDQSSRPRIVRTSIHVPAIEPVQAR